MKWQVVQALYTWYLRFILVPLRSLRSQQWQKRRVPVILQLSAVECGAACLAMIVSYYGRPTRIQECRSTLEPGRSGVSARSIVHVARQLGLRAKALSLDISHFHQLPLPAIIHWEFSHFVIVERWSLRHVDIIDPACGRRRLTANEFNAGFTGVALTFEPGTQFNQQRSGSPYAWRTYLDIVRQAPGVFGQILLASLVLQGFGLILPLFTQVVIDRIVPQQTMDILYILGAGVILFILAQTCIMYLRSALLLYLQARLDMQLMFGFFEHLLSLPFRFFEQRTNGDLLLRLNSNTIIRDLLSNQGVALLLDSLLVIGYITFLIFYAPLFGLLTFTIIAMQIGLLLLTTARMHYLTQRDVVAQTEVQGYAVEALRSIITIKAAGVEARAFDHWSNLFCKQINISLQRGQVVALIETAINGMRLLGPALLLWVGAWLVLQGQLSLGTMLAFNMIATLTLTPVVSLVQNIQRLQMVGAQLERIMDVLEEPAEQDIQAVHPAPSLTGRVELDNVWFHYDDAHTIPVLQDVNLVVESGQKVAIVGRTGAGKSTLARLLLGFYTPTSGTITYDNVTLESTNYQTLRNQFGVVLQESALFSGSIRQNIAMYDPTLTLDTIIQAAKQAAIHDDILKMPLGYDTILAEGGNNLSGGQRQRLILARALVQQPAILLLDEATSHLDVATERSITHSVDALACTRIVVAHRLSTVQYADRIVVLDQGRIVEQGIHTELLAQGGLYANLFLSQMTDTDYSVSAVTKATLIPLPESSDLTAADR